MNPDDEHSPPYAPRNQKNKKNLEWSARRVMGWENKIHVVTKALNISSLKVSKAFNNSSISTIALPHSSSHHTTDQLSRSLDTEALHPRSPNERCQVKPWIPLSEHHDTVAKMEMRILSSARYGCTLVSEVQPRRDFQDQKALDLDLILKVSIFHFLYFFQTIS